MILSGKAIKQAIDSDIWTCNKPTSELTFGPNSVDVTLGGTFLVAQPKDYFVVDLEHSKPEEMFREIISDNFIIWPNRLVLASVEECFDCINLFDPINQNQYNPSRWVQHYEGRSTLGRMGIQSHMTAGFGDYGFKGAFTLELMNNSPWPIILKKGMRIGQVYFEAVLGEVDKYEGYDQTDCKPQYPRLGRGRF